MTAPEAADGHERVQDECAAEGRGDALLPILHRWRLGDRLNLQESSTAGESVWRLNEQQQTCMAAGSEHQLLCMSQGIVPLAARGS